MPPRFVIAQATEVAALALAMVAAACCGADAGQVYTHSPLTLHGGPGDGFTVTDRVDSGTQIDVLWCNASSSWCLVQHDTGQGWAPLNSLKVQQGSASDDDTSVDPEPGSSFLKPGKGKGNASVADASNGAGGKSGGGALGNNGRGDSDGNSGSNDNSGNHGNSGHNNGNGNGRGNDDGGSSGGSLGADASLGGGDGLGGGNGLGVSVSGSHGALKLSGH